MCEYAREKWFDFYKRAMLELEQPAMARRIGDARMEIAARLEALSPLPGLHSPERLALQDALNTLLVLEREDEKAAAEKRKAGEEPTSQQLKTLTPKFEDDPS